MAVSYGSDSSETPVEFVNLQGRDEDARFMEFPRTGAHCNSLYGCGEYYTDNCW